MKRSLIFGLIAVLSAGLLLVACSDGSDSTGSSTVINGRLVDVAVASEESLASALLNPDYQIIGVIETFAYKTSNDLTIVTEIPVGKTVVLYTPIAVGTGGLEVKGEVIVDGSGELTAVATKRVLVSSGHIVVSNGKLTVDNVAAIYSSTPGSVIENPAFNTGGIRFENGTLNITAPVDNLGNIETLFNLVPRGELVLDEVLEAINPSVLAATIKTTATRRLSITEPVGHIGAGDPVEILTIPAGLRFTTADPLPELTSLTVLGNLTATEAKFAVVTDLTVAGSLTAAKGLYTKLTALTVSGYFAPPFGINGLTALTVDGPLGTFIAPSVGGAATGDTAGITLTVNAGGTAAIDAITNLKQGTIAGTLITTTNFTPLTPSAGSSAVSPLSATAGAIINGVPFTAETTEVTALADNAVTTGNFVVAASQILKIPANDAFTQATTLTIAAGATFTYYGQVILEADTGNLALVTGATGAKITGTGTITAGETVITGAWEAAGAEGTLTIESAATGATITPATGATGLTASAAGATIIQNGGTNGNALVIPASTEIKLAGTSATAKVGEIILKGHGTSPGSISLAATSSLISTGNTGTTEYLLATTGTTAISGVSDVLGIANVLGDGSKTKATTSTVISATVLPDGYLVLLKGDSSATVKGGALNNDGAISAETLIGGDANTEA
jgi:hypothetical protein